MNSTVKLDFTLGGDEAEVKLKEIFGGAHAPPRVVDRAPAVNPERSARARNAAPGAGVLPIRYRDVPGLCKAARIQEIEAQGESLNEELQTLNAAARELEATIASNVTGILEA